MPAHRTTPTCDPSTPAPRRLGSEWSVDGRTTVDGLALQGLTGDGRDAALAWAAAPVEPLDWGETREHVLLASTLPDQDPAPLVAAYRARWRAAARAAADAASSGLGADVSVAAAAEAWLAGLALTGRARPLVRARPRRGRRPPARRSAATLPARTSSRSRASPVG